MAEDDEDEMSGFFVLRHKTMLSYLALPGTTGLVCQPLDALRTVLLTGRNSLTFWGTVSLSRQDDKINTNRLSVTLRYCVN